MTPQQQRTLFKRALGTLLIILGIIGVVSLCMKEFPLALFGERSTGTVKKVEKITTSSGSAGQIRNGVRVGKKYGSELTFMYIAFETKQGKAMEVKTLATFNTEAKVGDQHPMIYLSSKPETAKIYSARQLWLPMIVGIIFSTVSLLGGFLLLRSRAVNP